MPLAVDISNQRFDRLVTIRRDGTSASGHATWLFQCDCGKTHVSPAVSVRSGKTKSCGCLANEARADNSRNNRHKIAIAKTKHGKAGTSIHNVWKTIIQRCTNPKSPDYPSYGGAGISVCERWRKFENFLGDMGERQSANIALTGSTIILGIAQKIVDGPMLTPRE